MATTNHLLPDDRNLTTTDILEGLSCKHLYSEPDTYDACVGTCTDCGIKIHNERHEQGFDLEYCTWKS